MRASRKTPGRPVRARAARGESQHAAVVDAWLKRSAKGLPSAALVQLFGAALGAVWTRTLTPLGEVTLTAIAQRVLHNAAEKFTFLSSLKIEPTGIDCEGLNAPSDSELIEGIRFVLVEFLTVLGNLTAEILTPELHSELSTVALPKREGPQS